VQTGECGGAECSKEGGHTAATLMTAMRKITVRCPAWWLRWGVQELVKLVEPGKLSWLVKLV
jgi:hypothetical protein